MRQEITTILIYSMPVILIASIILSIVLFIKRNKIIAKYNVGYVSSFLFTSCILSPILMGFAALIDNSEEAIFSVLLSLIYPIIGLIVFMIAYRGKDFKYKRGKFFAMLGIGICAGYIVVFKMLSFFHHYESSTNTSGSGCNINGRITSQSGQTTGNYYGNSGRITNQSGQTTGYYDKETGRVTNASGQTTGYYDKETGRVTNASGSTVGYVNRN